MIRYRSLSIIWISIVILSLATPSHAAPRSIALDAEGMRSLRPVRALRRYGLAATCLPLADGTAVIGRVSGELFVPIRARSVDLANRRAFKRRLAAARLRCARDARMEQIPGSHTRPIPLFQEWEEEMQGYGLLHCAALDDPSYTFEEKLLETYYDAEWVFLRIASYRREDFWHECARRAQSIYADSYAVASGGQVPGYWNFTHGLTEAFIRFGDSSARDAVILLAERAAYASDETSTAETRDAALSREVAYTIMAYMNAEKVGQPRRQRLASLVNQALGHIDQWFVSRSSEYVRPFMVGLTAQALISYAEATNDPRVLPALRTAAEELWRTAWISSEEAFKYTDRETDSGGTEPAPDLNLLIAPLYGWLYHQTGEVSFLERGDRIFAGGVRSAFLGNGKQFNQCYRWSFDYVRWRTEPPLGGR